MSTNMEKDCSIVARPRALNSHKQLETKLKFKRKLGTSTCSGIYDKARKKQTLDHGNLIKDTKYLKSVKTSLDRIKDDKSVVSTKGALSTVKKVTLRQSFQIQYYLNFTELLPALVHPELQFLRMEEIERIQRLPTDSQRANELLLVLGRRSSQTASKFLACLWLTREHLGHEELFSNIFPQVPEEKIQDIIQLCKSSSPSSPEKPPAFVELQGDLTDAKFLKVQGYLWELFGKGEYSRIGQLTSQLRSSPSTDWAIVGMRGLSR